MTVNIIKVLLADDSSVYKRIFAKAAAEAAEEIAIAYASDRKDAWEKIQKNKYDIIIMDADLAEPEAAGFIVQISEELPDAVILLLADPSADNKKLFAKIAREGKVFCLIKPIAGSYADSYLLMRRVLFNLVKGRRPPVSGPEPRTLKVYDDLAMRQTPPEIVMIASSTGGPSALGVVLSSLRTPFPAPILIVQHMPEFFTTTLVSNLRRKTQLPLKEAEHGELPAVGTVYIAPGHCHMKVDAEKKIYLEDSPLVNGVRPAADVLFESAAAVSSWTGILTVILTGMGRDGERGLRLMKEKHNCYCLAQNERTSIIYGMPRAVIESGLANRELDLDKIGSAMEACFQAGTMTDYY